ncbi:MAG: hypothetical protein CBC22_03180 [Alphaproteobacteria bacterium TMED62]|nr:MAG: hypothetical protein CBC22_03180 [Alphaproteobacteria bacterium TMED62]|tara:strand:- start:12506 stop:13369 length:864 start_codon:yes stop_codon:yes gene_type:complete
MSYKHTCVKLIRKNKNKCLLITNSNTPSFEEAKNFFIGNFYYNIETLYIRNGIMTGYYEPEVNAYNYKKNQSYPIYKINKQKYGDSIFKSPRNKINKGILKNKELEIAWIENEIEAFFLHIQGSGRLRFPNGKLIKIKYSGSNEKPYTAIGKILVDKKKIKQENISMFTIKKWLYKNPEKAREVMEKNERYIYFEEYTGEIKGSAGIKLEPMVSVAVDRNYYDLGDILLITEVDTKKSFLGIAHDTGSAIKGKNRIDLFTGFGKNAERLAAGLNKKVTVHKLKPLLY